MLSCLMVMWMSLLHDIRHGLVVCEDGEERHYLGMVRSLLYFLLCDFQLGLVVLHCGCYLSYGDC